MASIKSRARGQSNIGNAHKSSRLAMSIVAGLTIAAMNVCSIPLSPIELNANAAANIIDHSSSQVSGRIHEHFAEGFQSTHNQLNDKIYQALERRPRSASSRVVRAASLETAPQPALSNAIDPHGSSPVVAHESPGGERLSSGSATVATVAKVDRADNLGADSLWPTLSGEPFVSDFGSRSKGLTIDSAGSKQRIRMSGESAGGKRQRNGISSAPDDGLESGKELHDFLQGHAPKPSRKSRQEQPGDEVKLSSSDHEHNDQHGGESQEYKKSKKVSYHEEEESLYDVPPPPASVVEKHIVKKEKYHHHHHHHHHHHMGQKKKHADREKPVAKQEEPKIKDRVKGTSKIAKKSERVSSASQRDANGHSFDEEDFPLDAKSNSGSVDLIQNKKSLISDSDETDANSGGDSDQYSEKGTHEAIGGHMANAQVSRNEESNASYDGEHQEQTDAGGSESDGNGTKAESGETADTVHEKDSSGEVNTDQVPNHYFEVHDDGTQAQHLEREAGGETTKAEGGGEDEVSDSANGQQSGSGKSEIESKSVKKNKKPLKKHKEEEAKKPVVEEKKKFKEKKPEEKVENKIQISEKKKEIEVEQPVKKEEEPPKEDPKELPKEKKHEKKQKHKHAHIELHQHKHFEHHQHINLNHPEGEHELGGGHEHQEGDPIPEHHPYIHEEIGHHVEAGVPMVGHQHPIKPEHHVPINEQWQVPDLHEKPPTEHHPLGHFVIEDQSLMDKHDFEHPNIHSLHHKQEIINHPHGLGLTPVAAFNLMGAYSSPSVSHSSTETNVEATPNDGQDVARAQKQTQS